MEFKNLKYVSAMILLLNILPIQAVSSEMACKGFCPKIYLPFCGQDNTGHMKTFANECHFEYENCNNRDAGWRIIAQSDCSELAIKQNLNKEECSDVCPALYAPVCGIDNTGNRKTFPNKCMLKSTQCNNRDAGWKILDDGLCEFYDNSECPKACTREYMPVCGQDQTGNMKTFGNLCTFKVEQCENRAAGWKLLNQGQCYDQMTYANNDCPKVCPLIYAPICGIDNTGNQNTFANECMLKTAQCNNRAAGWKVLATGTCGNMRFSLNDCPGACTQEYKPVCGQDRTGNRVTFGNLCMFKMEQCNNRAAGWKLLGKGEC